MRAAIVVLVAACHSMPSATSHDAAASPDATLALPAQYTETLLDPTVYPTALCNDGTPAGYYPIAGSPTTTDWILFLPGGYACGTDAECAARATDLTTSAGWSATMTGAGVYGTTVTDNPHFADFNKVIIPYCTSDYFSGDAGPTGGTTNFQFRGEQVINAVITELRLHYGLGAPGQTVLLSGASAGGVSVLVNADRVAAMIPDAHVVGLVDAGWLPDVAPFTPPSFRTTIAGWMAFWNGHPDDSCAAAEGDQSFLCYFGEHAIAEITTPLLIVQNQNDPQGISHTGNITVAANLPAAQTNWINDVYSPGVYAGLAALPTTTGVFSTCNAVHTLTDSKLWTTTMQDGVALDDAAAAFFAATPQHELPANCKL